MIQKLSSKNTANTWIGHLFEGQTKNDIGFILNMAFYLANLAFYLQN